MVLSRKETFSSRGFIRGCPFLFIGAAQDQEVEVDGRQDVVLASTSDGLLSHSHKLRYVKTQRGFCHEKAVREDVLDGKDKETFHAIHLLTDSIKNGTIRPLLWLGAGASAWCGYPLWDALATDIFHVEFLRYESLYDKETATKLLEAKNYPEFFKKCKEWNENRYFSILAKTFQPKPPAPVYQRLLDTLQGIAPLFIVTTNVDECLESNLKGTTIVQRSDLERCLELIEHKQSFVCKLHGSISAIKSTVFTADDYSKLIEDENYLSLTRYIFSATSVIFIGYGFGDEYVLNLLSRNADVRSIFGDGPHFAILSEARFGIPKNVKIIKYVPIPHKDHRSAIQILDEIKIASSSRSADKPAGILTSNKIYSAHLLSDIYPPGTWHNSVTIATSDDNGQDRVTFIGNGLNNSELPLTQSTAMHDLLVGLLCFEVVYAPLSKMSRLILLLGEEFFWELIQNNCLRFIDWKSDLGMVYPSARSIAGGKLNTITPLNEDGTERSSRELIGTQIKPIEGKEKDAEKLLQLLDSKIDAIGSLSESSISDLVNGILLRPSIRSQIGMSGGISGNSIPRWMMYPILRLAHVIRIGSTCQAFGIVSVKLEFGSTAIAGAAFAVAASANWSDEIASYVLSGRFDTDLGKYVIQHPEVLKTVMRFRESQAGEALRSEVLDQLSYGLGSDFVTSVNAGLRAVISKKVLQDARDQFAGLLITTDPSLKSTPAIWNNADYAEKALMLWRKRSARELNEYCENNRISDYDLCPCGSGEKLRFCCKEALKM